MSKLRQKQKKFSVKKWKEDQQRQRTVRFMDLTKEEQEQVEPLFQQVVNVIQNPDVSNRQGFDDVITQCSSKQLGKHIRGRLEQILPQNHHVLTCWADRLDDVDWEVQDTLHIYTRVSSPIVAAMWDKHPELCVDRDKELGINKANELGMKYQVWNEGIASASQDDLQNTPVLMSLMNEIEDGLVKHLFVSTNDRLSRNENTQSIIRNALTRNEVVLYTKYGQYDLNNPQDKFIKTLLEGLASYENALKNTDLQLVKGGAL